MDWKDFREQIVGYLKLTKQYEDMPDDEVWARFKQGFADEKPGALLVIRRIFEFEDDTKGAKR